ncbi:hypothetical protein DMENIID0001_037990 [Sergentomyia squamirostris]
MSSFHFLQRNDESIDVALSVPQYNGHHQHSTQHFDMNDQTFHTPSFGDEDFDIPPMNPHMTQQQQQQHHQQQLEAQQQQQQQHQYQMHSTPPHHMSLMGDHYSHQWHSEQQAQQHMAHHNPNYPMPPQGQPNYPLTSPTHHQPSQQTHQMLMMQPPQQSPQIAPQMSPQIGGTGGGFIGRSPPQGVHGQTETGTTSDDSDDNGIPINSLKRPSPEPLMSDSANSPNGSGNMAGMKGSTTSAASKKPKVQKKKKKRDPNEPQKPVSAYALFFRDTQAAIKGQNPNASFGEVSKIVASMWDVLATEHKNVYKKKTEAAKKEYLKALAAYRASLVSKGSDSEQGQYPSPPHPQGQQTGQGGGQVPQQSPQHQQQAGTLMGGGPPSMAPQTSPHLPRPQQPQQPPPQQQPPSNQTPSPHYPPYSSPYKSPPQHQQVMMQQSLQMQHHNPHLPHQQQQQSMMNPMNSMGSMMGQMNPPPQQPAPQQQPTHPMNHPAMVNGAMMGMGGMPQYMNQQMHPGQSPHAGGHQMVGPPGGGGGGQISPHTMSPVSGTPPSNEHHPNQCIRHGCTNQAIVNQDWEDEYCSNECVITHCRDVFGNWVQSNQQQQQTYSAVK